MRQYAARPFHRECLNLARRDDTQGSSQTPLSGITDTFPPARHDTKSANSSKIDLAFLTIQITFHPPKLSLFSVPSVVTVSSRWRWTEGVPNAVGDEGIPGILLESRPDKVEIRGRTTSTFSFRLKSGTVQDILVLPAWCPIPTYSIWTS